MTRLLSRLALLLAILVAPLAWAQTPFAPVAVVNDRAITGFDLEQRVRLLQVVGGSQAEAAQLRGLALEQLIEDRLKLQEGARLGISPTDALVEDALERFAGQSGLSAEQLKKRLADAGITELALKDWIGAEAVWFEVVRSRFLSRVEPAEGEIDAEIGLIGQGGAATAYRLQEIGLPAQPGREAESEAAARELYRQLAAGGDFAAAVRQHSRAPSAAEGGEIGWVDANRLPPEIAGTLASLRPGQITPPVPVAAGFSIIKLLEVRRADPATAADASPEVRDEVRRRMIEQRIGRLSEGLLQELRRDALVQIR